MIFMVAINKSGNVVSQIVDTTKLQLLEVAPFPIKNDIQPTLDINPKYSQIFANISSTSSGNVTLYQVDSAKDFYVTSFTLSMIKDAACDMTAANTVKIFNSNTGTYLAIESIPLTAQNQTVTLPLPYPLLCPKGTLIRLAGTFAVGVCNRSATLTGFYL